MIGPAHLVMMLWLGGAVCFASFMFIFAKFDPEGFAKLDVAPAMVVIATALWPYALVKAFQMIQQESQWRERRRVRFPEPPVDEPQGSPKLLILKEPGLVPPTPCSSCTAAHLKFEEETIALYQRQPKMCPSCQAGWDAWVKENAADG